MYQLHTQDKFCGTGTCTEWVSTQLAVTAECSPRREMSKQHPVSYLKERQRHLISK